MDSSKLLIGHSNRIEKIKVSGNSMLPLYSDGDILMLDILAYDKISPIVGDIIVCKHPYVKDMLLIKKVSRIDKDKRLFIVGINPDESTDSRSFGTISQRSVLGKIICKFDDNLEP